MHTINDLKNRYSLTDDGIRELVDTPCFPPPLKVGEGYRWREVDIIAFDSWCRGRGGCEAQGLDPDILPPPVYTTQDEDNAERLRQEAAKALAKCSLHDDKPQCLNRWRRLVEAQIPIEKYEAETGDPEPREHIERAKERARKRCISLGIELPSEDSVLIECWERIERGSTSEPIPKEQLQG